MTLEPCNEESDRLDIRLNGFTHVPHLERQLNALEGTLQPGASAPSQGDASATALRVQGLLKARRARDQFFDPVLFADPAWDILLQAYVACLLEQRISVSALCDAAAVPATTALRWMNRLEQEGLLVRRDDPLDRRRTWMELTPAAAATMHRYLEATSFTSSI